MFLLYFVIFFLNVLYAHTLHSTFSCIILMVQLIIILWRLFSSWSEGCLLTINRFLSKFITKYTPLIFSFSCLSHRQRLLGLMQKWLVYSILWCYVAMDCSSSVFLLVGQMAYTLSHSCWLRYIYSLSLQLLCVDDYWFLNVIFSYEKFHSIWFYFSVYVVTDQNSSWSDKVISILIVTW